MNLRDKTATLRGRTVYWWWQRLRSEEKALEDKCTYFSQKQNFIVLSRFAAKSNEIPRNKRILMLTTYFIYVFSCTFNE